MTTQHQKQKPTIEITINGTTTQFDNFYRASHHIWKFIHDEESIHRENRCKEIETKGVEYVYEAKLVLEHRYKFWVATARNGRYNIRKGGRPFLLNNKEMFGLTGKELIAFAKRWEKLALVL